MPELREPSADQLVVEIESTGFTTDRVLTYRINSSYTTPTDAWEITVFSESPRELRRIWRPLQPVKLTVAGRPQLLGRIDGTEDVGESALKVFGRDYLADIVDSRIDPTFQVKKDQDIGDVVLEVLKPWGIKTVLGHNLNRNILTGKQPFAGKPKELKQIKLEDFKARENQGVIDYLNEILARHRLTLQPANTRDAVIVDSPRYEQAALYRVDRPGNVVTSSARRDYTNLPTVTLARSRLGGSTPGAGSDSGKVEHPSVPPNAGGGRGFVNPPDAAPYAGGGRGSVNPPNAPPQAGGGRGFVNPDTVSTPAATPAASGSGSGSRSTAEAYDAMRASSIGALPEVRRSLQGEDGRPTVRDKRFDPKKPDKTDYAFTPPVYKPLFYRDNESRNQDQLDASVRRMIAEKLRDTLTYEVTVRGHVEPTSGALWSVDTMVEANDEISDISETLWVSERTLLNDGRGPMTTMTLIRPGSYIF